jgi:uncharacterized protein YecE (DUF72 family)
MTATAQRQKATSQHRARILVGTASWADPGFIADWYPEGLPARKRLAWYAEHFSLVEVNSTFYAIPTLHAVETWVEQTPDDFVFDIKLPQLLSRHAMAVERLPPDIRQRARVHAGKVELTPAIERAVAKRLLEVMTPLSESGKLGAFLLQLTPGFSPRDHTLDELDGVVRHLEGFKLAIELRNRGWVTGPQLAKTKAYLRERGLTYVGVDAPQSEHFTVMPSIDLGARSELAYIRAHGRNTRGYITGRDVATRFNYVYSETELDEIAARAEELATLSSEVHVVFNNNKSNYAPKAAARFRSIVEERYPGVTSK